MNNGQQKAHPFINKNGDAEQGLTKREYFAGLAMQGLSGHPGTGSWSAERTATVSVNYADALLKELDKHKSE